MFLALIISLLVLVTGAAGQYLNVPEGTTYTVTGSETYDDFDVAGTLIIESSGSLSLSTAGLTWARAATVISQ
jgi:hypothetical protein